jgi:uncharacterized protein
MRWKVALPAWSFALFGAGLFCAARLSPPHPPWAVAWLVSYGLAHALLLAALTFLAGALIARKSRAAASAAATLFFLFLAADSFTYGLVGIHVDLNSIGYIAQDRAMTTLGLHRDDFLAVGGIAALAFAIAFAALPRAPLRPLLRVCLAAGLLDAGFACANAVVRFKGYQPMLGLADAMPLAWHPRWEGFLARVFHQPFQGVDGEELFPEPRWRNLEARTLRTFPWPARAQRTPDVLLVAIESLRADALAEMPNLRALAAKGLLAERHYSSGNCTFLGVFSLLTGLESTAWGARETWRAPKGAGAFAALGYEVVVHDGMEADFHMIDRTVPPGAARVVPIAGKETMDRDDAAVAWTASWLSSPRSRPGFAFLFLESTHWPYSSRKDNTPIPMVNSWTGRDLRDQMRERYSNAVRETDERLGRLFAALRGREESTVIVVTGDHGEAFREHGVFSHGSRLDEEQIRVPLVLALPGVAPGTLPGPSTHQDVLPTILGYLGAARLASPAGQGVDLLAKEPRQAPPMIGACGIRATRGFAALVGDEKVLLQIDDKGATFTGAIGEGDLRLQSSRQDSSALRAAAFRAANALLSEASPL